MNWNPQDLGRLVKGPALVAVAGKWHGLGNRVRAVLGSRVLARHEGRHFSYVWPTGAQFGAALEDLWVFDAPVVSSTASRLLAMKYPYRDNTLAWLDPAAREERLWQIQTPHALLLPEHCPPWESDLQDLQPAPEISKLVMKSFGGIPAGNPYVGVMIRTNRNAHEDTLKHSPVQWYLRRMREIREFWPEVHFYVSADTPEAFREVRQEISHCHGQESKGAYNSREALIASVVDLYMLAASAHLLAPHFSSFPELSQRMAGPELRLETSMNDADNVLTSTVLAQPGGCSAAANPLQPNIRHPL